MRTNQHHCIQPTPASQEAPTIAGIETTYDHSFLLYPEVLSLLQKLTNPAADRYTCSSAYGKRCRCRGNGTTRRCINRRRAVSPTPDGIRSGRDGSFYHLAECALSGHS